MDTLNPGQQSAFNAIMEGKSIFLTGPGGTGKSFLIKEVYDKLSSPSHSVSLTAMTGCAALLLHSKAKTLHSWSGIGLGTDVVPLLVGKIKKSRRAKLNWRTDTLVIDEVSMMTPELFEKLEEIARKLRDDPRPFGGLQLIMVGDFFQLPPVSKGEVAFVFESPLWTSMGLTTHALTEIVRQKNPEFQAILNEARTGSLTKASLKVLRRRMDLDYKSLEIQPSMLFTRRGEVDSINATHLKKITAEKKTYKATTTFNPITQTRGLSTNSPEVQAAVQALDKVASYSVELTLAVGAQVMLLNNKSNGLVNGSRGVVVGFERPPVKEAGDLSGAKVSAKDQDTLFPLVKFKGGTELIQFHDWELQEFPGVKRQQIPLKLAYAITIHKAQGATLDCALIDVGGRTFEYGQAYTALSRVKDMESLYIHDLAPEAFKAHPKVVAFYASQAAAASALTEGVVAETASTHS
jgi:ATP-dependent DNA helicase PIF1